MAVNIQGGAAQPVQTSNQQPSAGPAIPIAVLSDVEAAQRGVTAGAYMAVVAVTDGRPRMGGAAVPVVLGTGSGWSSGDPPTPVYVVYGALTPPSSSNALLLETGDYILLEDGSKILLES